MKSLSVIFFGASLLASVILSGCSQQENLPVEGTAGNNQYLTAGTDNSFLAKSYDVPLEVMEELQQVKAATARYNNFNNAIADGYVDINVVVPHMGHHFLKPDYLNATFEVDKPEILVYSPHPVTGQMRLVAVEYGVPIALSQNPPEGFTGNLDTWGVYNNELWTLHAWIWEYNPDGVFAPMNPLVP